MAEVNVFLLQHDLIFEFQNSQEHTPSKDLLVNHMFYGNLIFWNQ